MAGSLAGDDEKVVTATPEWVNCPVCGTKVNGEECVINSHLDVCLNRGIKRKLTQQTLLQMNFHSQLMAQSSCRKLQTSGTGVVSGVSHSSTVKNNVNGFENSVRTKERATIPFESWDNEELYLGTDVSDSIEQANDDDMNCLVDPSSSFLEAERFKCDATLESGDDKINCLLGPSSAGLQNGTAISSIEVLEDLYWRAVNGRPKDSGNIIAVGNSKNNALELPVTVESCLEISITDSDGKANLDEINCMVDHFSSSLNEDTSERDVAVAMDEISGKFLDTYIVGRKFSTEKDLNLGASISLLRDPENPKDPNAIKVLLADSQCSKVLGFLPRELAQHLSPLIEKFHLEFETYLQKLDLIFSSEAPASLHHLKLLGCVTSVPQHSLDIVPIQIVCCKVVSYDDKDQNDVELFRCSWKSVLHVVASAKNHSPTMAKYQQNFHLLIQEVLKSNPHLFIEDEKVFIESFTSLPDDCQRLFVRLYMRKGPWFKMSNVSYPEVMDLQQAVEHLFAMGYMHVVKCINELQKDDIREILNLLTVAELREIACTFKKNCVAPTSTRKQDLVAALFSSYEDGLCPSLLNLILDRTGICVKISSKAKSLVRRAERLFFLNEEQDLSTFLLADLGIIKYPTYKCIMLEPVFSSRTKLLDYEEAIEMAEQMEESLDKNNGESVFKYIEIAETCISSSAANHSLSTICESVTAFLLCYSASWVYAKVLFLGIDFLERQRRYKQAVNFLKQLLAFFPYDGRRGCWTLRLSIDLEHMGCPNESLLVAEEGLLDPWIRAGSRLALQRRILRLGKPPRRWKVPSFASSVKRKIKEVHIQGRPLNCVTGAKSRFYGEDGDQCGVEQLALQYYAGEGGGWKGVHTESGIWLTIFGLLMWDIIFSDVPDVFHNRFQTAPLDFGTDSFYVVRKAIIECHLQKIHDGMAEEILVTSWLSHFGTSCRGVCWDRHSLSDIRAAVICIGGPCLALLCRHLAQDYRSWSSGMPDLVLWRFHGEYDGEAKLVEVKGPRDNLSEQQRAWLLLLMDCGFSTEICKVSAVPSYPTQP